MLNLSFNFLLKDKITPEDIWNNYFSFYENYEVNAHCYSGSYTGSIPVNQVEIVKTSWLRTIKAHFQLYKQFLQGDCTHFILLSESCCPLRVIKELNDNVYLTGYNFKPLLNHRRNNIYRTIKKYVGIAEQWTILPRWFVVLMVENEKWIMDNFGKHDLDNEHYLITFITYKELQYIINPGQKTWLLKRSKGAHPDIVSSINQRTINDNPESYFCRKVNEKTKIDFNF